MAKDTQISIRLDSELLARIDAAAKLEAERIGYPVSRNRFIEVSLQKAIDEVCDEAGIEPSMLTE